MSNYKLVGSFLIVTLLLTSFFNFQYSNAAYMPDLSIVRVSNYDTWSSVSNEWGGSSYYHKLVPGYTVTVYNAGTGASQNTTMNFFIKTFDNKTLVKYIKVPALNPGQSKRVSFSMNNGTDGSFKEGYAVINPLKTFNEISFKNNIRKFGLQEVILKNSTKNVTEVYQVPGSNITWSGTTTNYTSPLSGKTGITRMYCKINFELTRDLDIRSITVPIPGYLHDNVTMGTYGGYQSNSGHPTSWNDTSCTFMVDKYYNRLEYAEITVTGQNLENKHVFSEPIQVTKQVFNPYQDVWTYSDIANGLTRNVQEDYSGISLNSTTYSGTAFNYTVHHKNVVSLKIIGDNRGLYTAGWFITPIGSVNSVNAIYGSNQKPAILIANGRYGISHRMRDISPIGFEINGTNLQGFNNFKSLGFSSWTWQPSS